MSRYTTPMYIVTNWHLADDKRLRANAPIEIREKLQVTINPLPKLKGSKKYLCLSTGGNWTSHIQNQTETLKSVRILHDVDREVITKYDANIEFLTAQLDQLRIERRAYMKDAFEAGGIVPFEDLQQMVASPKTNEN